ncbi:MAG: molybdate ABC transporter substrate-binding protein [Pyrinomonadaceae bacterium]
MKERHFWKLAFVAFVAFTAISCGNNVEPNKVSSNSGAGSEADKNPKYIVVSAAISLKETFDELATLYKQKTGTKLRISYAASGVLSQQIEKGAGVDVFASAGQPEMNKLEAGGFLIKETRKDFAGNSMVLIVAKDSTLGIGSFDDLGKADIRNLAIGNPKTVPAGAYGVETLKSLGVYDKVAGKFVFGESVRQVLEYVSQGNAEAGIVYSTDADISKATVNVVATAPEDSHSPIRYPIAVINDSKKADDAREFIAFVMSEEGQQVLQKYGFKNLSAK